MTFSDIELSNLSELITKGTTPTTMGFDFQSKGVNFYKAQDLLSRYLLDTDTKVSIECHDALKRSKIKKNDLLVSIAGTIGRVSLWNSENEANCNQAVAIVRSRPGINFLFNYYALTSPNVQDQIKKMTKTTAQPNLNLQELGSLLIPQPSSLQQKVIANILSSLDDKIELNNKINKSLEELAQTLYKRWFVDFEFPNENGEPYKSSGGEMVESELGLIPKEWGISNLLEIADYMNGIAVKKYAADEGEISMPVLKIKELGLGNITSDSDRCNLSVPEKYIIKKGDLIFSWSGTLLVDFWTGSKSVLNQHLFKVSSNKYPRWFYYYWTKYHLEKFQNIAKSMATTMGHIKRDDLSKSLVVIPVNNHLEQGSITLEPIIDEILKLRIQNNKLSKLRDELLPKLMNGEIAVPIEE